MLRRKHPGLEGRRLGPLADPGADTIYSVTVSKVLIDGVLRSFAYNVIVFDPGL